MTYWSERAQRERERADKKTEREFKKELEDLYRMELGQLRKELDAYIQNFAEKNGLAVEDAKKNIFTVPVIGTTIPHEITGRYGAGSVYMRPAIEGTGVIAGGATRAILELAGISDILTKCLGSRTKINVVRATVDALQNLRTVESVAALRGKKPEEIRG